MSAEDVPYIQNSSLDGATVSSRQKLIVVGISGLGLILGISAIDKNSCGIRGVGIGLEPTISRIWIVDEMAIYQQLSAKW